MGGLGPLLGALSTKLSTFFSTGNENAPGARSGGAGDVRFGTAYRIRTGDLRLERAVSWATRRMRRGPDFTSQPMRLDEGPNALGDHHMAFLAGDDPVVRVAFEQLVLGAEPLGQARAVCLREETV